jgi:hypothetical protein
MNKAGALSRQLAFQVSITFALLLASCGSAFDSGDGKGGECQPCNDNRVCDSGLSCYAFSGDKELCAKPSTKSCVSANGDGKEKSILRTLKIQANSNAFGLDVSTK